MTSGEKGQVGISREVVMAIAGIANLRSGDPVFRRGEGLRRHVETEVEGEEVKVTVRITAVYGHPIRPLAVQVQRRVKMEIERMTGLRVSAVDVEVQHLVRGEEPAPEEIG